MAIHRVTLLPLDEIESNLKNLPWDFEINKGNADLLKQTLNALGVRAQVMTQRPKKKQQEPKEQKKEQKQQDKFKKPAFLKQKSSILVYIFLILSVSSYWIPIWDTPKVKKQTKNTSRAKANKAKTNKSFPHANPAWAASINRLQNHISKFGYAPVPTAMEKLKDTSLPKSSQILVQDSIWVLVDLPYKEIFESKAKRFLQKARAQYPQKVFIVVEAKKGWIIED
jgi:hypothetical protein